MQKQKLIAIIAVLCGLWLAPMLKAAEGGEVPQRVDIPEQYRWDLSDLYADSALWEADFSFLDKNLSRFEDFRGHLGESAARLLACLKLQDSLGLILENLYVYANLKKDEDQRVPVYQEMSDRIMGLYSRYQEATSFVTPEILEIDSAKLASFLKTTPDLDVYRFYLSKLERQKAHILSDKEEAILAMAGAVTSSPRTIFGMVNNADIEYGTVTDENGQQVQLTKERYYAMLESPLRRLRREANHVYNTAYVHYKNTLAATLAASVKGDYFYMSARHYPTCLAMALDDDSIPPAVFHNLINAVNANLAPLHKWTSLRKRILGVDTLFTFDLYAPLTSADRKHYTYEEAEKTVLEGLKPMGKQYLRDFEHGLKSRWVDVYETRGKRSGAYQWGTFTSSPKLLLNFNGTLDNVFTLAHEMGHAMNSYYTKKHEPYIYDGHSTFTAEVASTCNEAVLMKYMLEHTQDRQEKIELLVKYIEQILGTFYTQVMFSEFELAIHNRIESGGAISASFLRQTYRGIYQKYWGPELVIDSLNDMGGMRIPHFYGQYYVYQYATSYAAAQMLSQEIIEKAPGIHERYLRFLETGRSEYPVDILRDAGVDMTTPEPINRTIKLFAQLVDQVEALLDEK